MKFLSLLLIGILILIFIFLLIDYITARMIKKMDDLLDIEKPRFLNESKKEK